MDLLRLNDRAYGEHYPDGASLRGSYTESQEPIQGLGPGLRLDRFDFLAYWRPE